MYAHYSTFGVHCWFLCIDFIELGCFPNVYLSYTKETRDLTTELEKEGAVFWLHEICLGMGVRIGLLMNGI